MTFEIKNELPDWWEANKQLRSEMDLPAYDPPKFSDGTYTHEIIPCLEKKHGVAILFGIVNPEYPDDWNVWIDGQPVFSIGRYRDNDANTVYELTADEFQTRVERLC